MNRARFGSKLEIPYTPDVYEILERHDNAIGELKGLAHEGKIADAQILTKLSNIEATDRHATTKLISALVITVITTIGGVIGTVAAMRPGAAQAPIVVQRSELDKKMDVCRAMPPGPSQSECFVRLATEHAP